MVVEKIARYLGEHPEEVSFNLESVYRVYFGFVIKNQLPRDVVIQMVSRKMKDDIVIKSYKDPLEFDGKSIKIMKELPKKVIESRKILNL